jgi:hypothetical protein
MSNVREMFDKHPHKDGFNVQALDACLRDCFDCADYCTVCADACLEEDMVKDLRKCIRLNLECADICAATGNLLLKSSSGEWGIVTKQLETCELAARFCREECARHSSMHEHCRLCADMCNRCAVSCRKLINELSSK